MEEDIPFNPRQSVAEDRSEKTADDVPNGGECP